MEEQLTHLACAPPTKKKNCACMSSLQDVKWALYAVVAGAKKPQGLQCEVCFHVWSRGFQHLTWAELVELSEQPSQKAILEGCRKIVMGGPGLAEDVSKAGVESLQGTYIQVEQSYLGYTEKDMRKLTGLSRIDRACLKGLPSITVPCCDGTPGEEQLYLFIDEGSVGKKVVMKSVLGTELISSDLVSKNCIWTGQAPAYRGYMAVQQCKKVGIADVMSKEAGGHLTLQLFRDFAGEVLLGGSKDGGGGDDAEDGAEAQAEGHDDVEVTGVAAGVPQGQQLLQSSFWSPPAASTKKPKGGTGNGIVRAGSAASLQTTPQSADGASSGVPGTVPDGRSVVAGSAAESSLGDFDEGLFGNTPNSKTKVALEAVLDGSVDGRSIQGLKRAYQRMVNSSNHKAEGLLLGNYHKVVVVAQSLNPSNLAAASDQDLQQAIHALQAEGVTWPETTKYSLVMRKAMSLLKDRKWTDFLDMMHPWSVNEEEVFNPVLPKVGALQDKSKLFAVWRKLLFQELLGQLLDRGQPAEEDVKLLATMCVERYSSADFLMLDNRTATALDEALACLRALLALIDPFPSLDTQVVGENILPRDAFSMEFVQIINVFGCVSEAIVRLQTTSKTWATKLFYAIFILSSVLLTSCGNTPLHHPLTCFDPKVDVERLKNATARTTKNILSQVAVAVDGSPHWKARMEEYFTTLPAQVERGPTLQRFVAALQSPLGLKQCSHLHEILVELPVLQRSLRAGACARLENELLHCLLALGEEVLQGHGTGELSGEEAGILLDIMAEGTAAFPMDAKLQTCWAALADIVKQSALNDLLKNALSLLEKVTEAAGGTDDTLFGKALQEASDHCSKLALPASVWSKKAVEKRGACVQALFNFMSARWSGDTQRLVQCGTLAEKLGSFAEAGDMKKAITIVVGAVQMQDSLKKLEACNLGEAGTEALDLTVNLHRKIHLCDKPMLTDDQWGKHKIWDVIDVEKKKASETCESFKAKITCNALKDLDAGVKDLAVIHRGADEGKDWLDTFQGENWEDFMEHAKNTILKMGAKQLVNLINVVKKALYL
eukprot:6492373-Amphidinium_carterae.2